MNCCKLFQVVQNGSKLFQVVPNCSKLFQLARERRSPGSSSSSPQAFDAAALKQMKEFKKMSERMLHEAVKDNPDLRSVFERHYLEVCQA